MSHLTIKLSELHPNPWNPNELKGPNWEKFLKSLQEEGQLQEIIVRELPEGYQIIDGEQRSKGLAEIGATEARIFNLGEVDDARAKKLTINLNRLKGEDNTLKLAALLQDLSSSVGVDDLLESLPYEPFEIENLLNIEDIDLFTGVLVSGDEEEEILELDDEDEEFEELPVTAILQLLFTSEDDMVDCLRWITEVCVEAHLVEHQEDDEYVPNLPLGDVLWAVLRKVRKEHATAAIAMLGE
jgi:hypothetical protein